MKYQNPRRVILFKIKERRLTSSPNNRRTLTHNLSTMYSIYCWLLYYVHTLCLLPRLQGPSCLTSLYYCRPRAERDWVKAGIILNRLLVIVQFDLTFESNWANSSKKSVSRSRSSEGTTPPALSNSSQFHAFSLLSDALALAQCTTTTSHFNAGFSFLFLFPKNLLVWGFRA